MNETIGTMFEMLDGDAAEVIAGLGSYTIAMNDPPWSEFSSRVPPPARVVAAWDMEQAHLDELAEQEGGVSEVVVGFGGGTALDTAKHLAWRTGKRLVQIPTITSVDAGFTDAVGVRVDGKVRYVGKIEPELVVLDVDLVRSAPRYLNRAGIGDILSCLTGLHDWRLAVEAGQGPPWRHDLAALGKGLLADLVAAASDIEAVTADGVRFLAGAYRRIGAACAEAGHSRFEEGSEHFWAYAYEAATGAHHVHGELIAFAVVAMATLQGEGADAAAEIVARSGARAHPDDLGIGEDAFTAALLDLPSYVRAEDLGFGFVDVRPPSLVDAARAWSAAASLPRRSI